MPYVAFAWPGAKQPDRRAPPAGRPRSRRSAARAEQLGLADDAARWDEPGQHRARHVEERQQLVVPSRVVEVEEHRARGVRDVGDVLAAVSFHTSQESTVPKARSPAAPRRASSHSSFVAEKYGSVTSPVRSRISSAGSSRSAQRAPALPDDRAVRSADRFARSHTHGRLALVRDPDRGELARADPRSRERVPGRVEHRRQISSGSCSTSPGAGKLWRARGSRARAAERVVDDEAGRPVVPWSIASSTGHLDRSARSVCYSYCSASRTFSLEARRAGISPPERPRPRRRP